MGSQSMTEVIYWNGVPKRGGTIVEFPFMDGFGLISCGVRGTASVCKPCNDFPEQRTERNIASRKGSTQDCATQVTMGPMYHLEE